MLKYSHKSKYHTDIGPMNFQRRKRTSNSIAKRNVEYCSSGFEKAKDLGVR